MVTDIAIVGITIAELSVTAGLAAPGVAAQNAGYLAWRASQIAAKYPRPRGVPSGYVSGPARNGNGTVWREPGTTDNANIVRFGDPDSRYPYGYARFYNEGKQPVRPDGKPGSNPDTHLPLSPNGEYEIPKGW